MAKQSDLQRVRSAIEALNAGTLVYSEFDAVVASAVAAGSMTREDVRHELEAALMAENVRREPPAPPAADLRIPPERVRPVRHSRTMPDRSRRASRAWVGRLLAGIAVFALIGAFAGFMIPRLQLDRGSSLGNAPEAVPLPDPTAPPIAAVVAPPPPVPAPPSVQTPPAASPPSPAEAVANLGANATNEDVPKPEAANEDVPLAPRVNSTPPVSSPSTGQTHAAAAPVATTAVIPQENPDSPPANSQTSPHLHVAQGYETFADLCPYPRTALAHGETGKVGLLAYVAPDGHVLNTAIVSTSGSEDLDVAASMCLKDKGHFVPKFAAGHAVGYWGRMTFNWSFGE